MVKMSTELWQEYCSFYEKPFSEQLEYNERNTKEYFGKWKSNDFARMLSARRDFKHLKDVPLTTYSDYTMLNELGLEIQRITSREPRKKNEGLSEYYQRVTRIVGALLDRYMVEPLCFCPKTTGTTGMSKWLAHGQTFWKNFSSDVMANAIICCSDGWGKTRLEPGDAALNLAAPIPYISGYGVLAYQPHFELVPPIEISEKVDMQQIFLLILEAIRKGKRISVGGGPGAIFYMICKYFMEPEDFYSEFYRSLGFGLRKILLSLMLLKYKLRGKESKTITDFVPFKGIAIGGMESRLYTDFIKKEFNLEPLNIYGSTEGGFLMRGDPDMKTDLVPNLRSCYFEFSTDEGEIKRIDEVKKGEVYELVITPFGSIVLRYNMEDLFRVVDHRDDGMPVFEFEGRERSVIRLYNYVITPSAIVEALSGAGLEESDKWAATKILKPSERLCFLMERTWSYSESEAEKAIFRSLMETEKMIPYRGHTLQDYVFDFRIKEPSEVVKVEYLKRGAFLRYSKIKAKEGVPLGQYKPPKIIPPEKPEIYETLRTA